MTEKKEMKEFQNMFDTPVGGGSLGEASDDMESFDSLSDSLEGVVPEGKSEEIIVEEQLKEVSEPIVEEEAVKEEAVKEEEVKEEEVKEEEVKEEAVKEEEVKEEEVKEEEVKEEETYNGQVQWFLDSPTPLYNDFYLLKKDMINRCTPGGYLPFDEWTNELIGCHVDIKKEVFDNKSYIEQMTKIQNYMERVKNIQIKCNNQYFLWEVFVPNLKGCLARVEYLKPAIKQDGLVNQHMKDIEWYYAKVQHIHESAKGVMKTLEKAFETVSRKASLATPSRPAEKYHKEESREIPEPSKSNDYDKLPDNAQATVKKSGEYLDWGEIG
jgi:hypothetical protein